MALQNSGKNDKDIEAAMAALSIQSSAGQAVMGEAQKLLDSIAKMFGDSKGKNPKEIIANAKALAAQTQDMYKSLVEMAAKVTDPIFKEKLLNASKVIKDAGLQIKILSAVQSAGASKGADPVAQAAKTLQNNILRIVNEVGAEQVRTRYKDSVQRTMAMNKVVNILKGQNK